MSESDQFLSATLVNVMRLFSGSLLKRSGFRNTYPITLAVEQPSAMLRRAVLTSVMSPMRLLLPTPHRQNISEETIRPPALLPSAGRFAACLYIFLFDGWR
jgi:hypothetical protein